VMYVMHVMKNRACPFQYFVMGSTCISLSDNIVRHVGQMYDKCPTPSHVLSYIMSDRLSDKAIRLSDNY
jgi:hypothetical protein